MRALAVIGLCLLAACHRSQGERGGAMGLVEEADDVEATLRAVAEAWDVTWPAIERVTSVCPHGSGGGRRRIDFQAETRTTPDAEPPSTDAVVDLLGHRGWRVDHRVDGDAVDIYAEKDGATLTISSFGEVVSVLGATTCHEPER